MKPEKYNKNNVVTMLQDRINKRIYLSMNGTVRSFGKVADIRNRDSVVYIYKLKLNWVYALENYATADGPCI